MAKYILTIVFLFLTAFAASAQDETEIEIEYPRVIKTSVMPAYSVTVTETEPGIHIVRFDGTLEYMSGYLLNTLVQRYKPIYVDLNSTGGTLIEMLEPGQTLRKHGIPVRVLKDDICLSACAYLAMYSPHIDIQGQLGLHSPYRPTFGYTETLQDLYDNGAMIQNLLTVHAYDNGWPLYLYYTVLLESDRNTYLVFEDTDAFHSYRWAVTDEQTFTGAEYEFEYKKLTFPEINRRRIEKSNESLDIAE